MKARRLLSSLNSAFWSLTFGTIVSLSWLDACGQPYFKKSIAEQRIIYLTVKWAEGDREPVAQEWLRQDSIININNEKGKQYLKEKNLRALYFTLNRNVLAYEKAGQRMDSALTSLLKDSSYCNAVGFERLKQGPNALWQRTREKLPLLSAKLSALSERRQEIMTYNRMLLRLFESAKFDSLLLIFKNTDESSKLSAQLKSYYCAEDSDERARLEALNMDVNEMLVAIIHDNKSPLEAFRGIKSAYLGFKPLFYPVGDLYLLRK